jgi:hypothetical protein
LQSGNIIFWRAIPKNEKPRLFVLLLFLPKQKKSNKKTAFFQLSKGVSNGTLVFLFRALVLMLPPEQTGQLTFSRTATLL